MLVSGTPGVGKTTLSKLLAKELDIAHYEIGNIARERDALVEKDVARDSYLVDVGKVSKYLAKLNQPMVIDGHILLKLPQEKIKRIIVLRCNPVTLALRLKKKRFPTRKIVENVLAEVTDACLLEAVNAYGKDHIFELDTTRKTVRTCVRNLVNAVQKEISRVGVCDWLSVLRREQLQYLEVGKLWPMR